MRIVELLVAINAFCGIAAFIMAKGLAKKAANKWREFTGPDGEDERRHTA